MVSEVDICNAALVKLGDENTISALGQDGREGEICELMYPQVRDRLLASHPWNFAIGRRTLIADTTDPDFEFNNQYFLPGDFLRALGMFDSQERWKIEGDKLLTDENIVQLLYIKKVTNTGQYPALFSETISSTLAGEIAEVITGSTNKAKFFLEEGEKKHREAKRRDGQEGTPDNFQSNVYTSTKSNVQWW